MNQQLSKLHDWLGQGSINIFGMPYAGKDTQGSTLADLFNTELIGGGAILRASVIPDRVKAIMERGELVPIADYLEIVLPFLSHQRFAGKPLILSSVGRWQGEEHGVLEATDAAGHPIKAAVLLTVNQAVARERHATGGEDRGLRADDSDAVFDNRILEFETKTRPVIETYRQRGLLLEINGDQSPPQVTADIIARLLQFSQS